MNGLGFITNQKTTCANGVSNSIVNIMVHPIRSSNRPSFVESSIVHRIVRSFVESSIRLPEVTSPGWEGDVLMSLIALPPTLHRYTDDRQGWVE